MLDIDAELRRREQRDRQLVEIAMQAGRDEMAQVLADKLDELRLQHLDNENPYVDGIDDALCMLIQAGATNPGHPA